MPQIVENVKTLLGKKPLFGICMGHQILGQALGGTTFKLKFGHHGGNHPIRYGPTGQALNPTLTAYILAPRHCLLASWRRLRCATSDV